MVKQNFNIRYVLVLIIYLMMSMMAFSQNQFSSSEELIENANQYFLDEDYIKAFPLYSQLLSLERDNPEYLYRFGVCLLYSDRSDTYAPIDYMKKALNHINDPDIYYHLGFAYHITYNFPAAISYYNDYLTKVGKKAKKSFDVPRKIEMCKNGIEMMRSFKDLFVLNKSEVPRDEFFRSYNLKDYGGKMIKKPAEFMSKEDEKKNNNNFIFFNSKSNEIYYSSYGKDHKEQKDIYKRIRKEDGNWSDPIRLPKSVNTDYDDEYPVIMPDGKTLYFSSKGHNTMGGFDIFKTVYDPLKKTWSVPENINFPFNTPVDDILFVPDTLESTAWFASVRNSADQDIMVYRVGIIKKPGGSEDLAAIYAKNKQLTENDLRAIQDKARLDVNISQQEYEEIPDLEADLLTQNKNLHENQLEKIDESIAQKEREQVLIDSAKFYVDAIEKNIESFDSLRQKAVSLSASKRIESKRLKEEIKNQLSQAINNSDYLKAKVLVNRANENMVKSERLEYEALELDQFATNIKSEIDKQRGTFRDVNSRYGDAERAVITGSEDRARSIIQGMQMLTSSLPDAQQLNQIILKNSDELNINYPVELTDNNFEAFVLNNQNNQLQISSFNQRYDEFIPRIESRNSGYIENANYQNPKELLEGYLNTLLLTSKSIDLEVNQIEEDINKKVTELQESPLNPDEKAIALLNEMELEKSVKLAESNWLKTKVETTKSQLESLQSSNKSEQEKLLEYNRLTSGLEADFNFNDKTINSNTIQRYPEPLIAYKQSEQGGLTTEVKAPILIASDEIAFNSASKDLLDQQALQMLVDGRKLRKENQFLLKKIENNLNERQVDYQSVLAEANAKLESARTLTGRAKEDKLKEANEDFNQAKTIELEINSYERKYQDVSNALLSQNLAEEEQGKLYEDLIKTINAGEFDQAKINYEKLEKTHQNILLASDFSKDIIYPSGELKNKAVLNTTSDSYVLTSDNQIVANDANAVINKPNAIIEEPIADAIQNLQLSPNFSMETRQSQWTKIFEPQTIPGDEEIKLRQVSLPMEITSSENALMNNAVMQINNLTEKTNYYIERRNQLYQYYQDQLKQSDQLESESLQYLSGNNISSENLKLANELSLKSKENFLKASAVASIIRQYDEKIAANASLIETGYSTLNEMNNLIENGQMDNALLKSVQLQRKQSDIEQNKIDDSSFDFIANEINIQIPAEFSLDQNQEFVVKNGNIERNNGAYLNQYLYQSSYPVQTDVLSSPMLVTNDLNSQVQADTGAHEISSKDIAVANNRNLEDSDSNVEITSPVHLEDLDESQLRTAEDILKALSQLNKYTNSNTLNTESKIAKLTDLSEDKLRKSNDLSILAENSQPPEKNLYQDSAKIVLYEALAIQSLIKNLNDFLDTQKANQEILAQYSPDIKNHLESNRIQDAKNDFQKMISETDQIDIDASEEISSLESLMLNQTNQLSASMDSAFSLSQELANESVKMLTLAAEDRGKAEGKKNAFKRRELLKLAEDRELEAARLQNESEKALAMGNQFYQQIEINQSIAHLSQDLNQIKEASDLQELLPNQQAVVSENIKTRKAELIDGQLSTTNANLSQLNEVEEAPLAKTDDIHVYQRENFKAEMISEEIDLLKREIAILVQSQNQNLSDQESYIVAKKIDLLRIKADSLEYEADKAFEFANRVLNSLSDEEQLTANEKGRNFESYLKELKGKIEILLSEAASLKQRAQRSNNIETRKDLFEEAKDKEEVAMYLILEEFEVIAQKNKTRYRRNQLILEQLLIEKASPEERELMRNIFNQIDDYFAQADQKRKKANEEGISFNMKKILLQDAYSLEMKALDLQQQAKKMLENSDIDSMMAYQPELQEQASESTKPDESKEISSNQSGVSEPLNTVADISSSNKTKNNEAKPLDVETGNTVTASGLIPEIRNSIEEGTLYRVQFIALKELKETKDFPGIREISAERVNGTDYIRYYSGNFDNYEDALIRRNTLRVTGYADAFIKSWKNGEEVNLLDITSENATASSPSLIFSANTQINNVDFSATNISSLQGVYYTVQVGVYSRPRTSSMIFGVSPLYHKRMDNGYWVYYSGIFKSISSAEIKKEEIRKKGVSDAFIVAFSNGTQVNLAEARLQISRGEDTPSDESIVILEDASVQINKQWDLSRNNVIDNESVNSDELVYKIQVGVYSNPISLSWISSQLDNSNPVESYQNVNGKYVYTVGNFNNESEARSLLKEISELVPDAFIVGFQNGQKKYIR